MQDWNASTIQDYARNSLERAPKSLDSAELGHLLRHITEYSQGVILWTRFVCAELTKGLAKMETYHQLQKRLDNYPRDLDDVYERLLSQIEGPSTVESLLCLYLISHITKLESMPSALDILAVLSQLSLKSYFLKEIDLPSSVCRFSRAMKSRLGHLVDVLEQEYGGYEATSTICPNCRDAENADCHGHGVNVRLIHKSLHSHLLNQRPIHLRLPAKFLDDYDDNPWAKLTREIWSMQNGRTVSYGYLQKGALRSRHYWAISSKHPHVYWEFVEESLYFVFLGSLDTRHSRDWAIGISSADAELIQAVANGIWEHADHIYGQLEGGSSAWLPHVAFVLAYKLSTAFRDPSASLSGHVRWFFRCVDALSTPSLWASIPHVHGFALDFLLKARTNRWPSFLFERDRQMYRLDGLTGTRTYLKREQLLSVVNSALQGIFMISPSSRFMFPPYILLHSNPAARSLLGDIDQRIGSGGSLLHACLDSIAYYARVNEVVESEESIFHIIIGMPRIVPQIGDLLMLGIDLGIANEHGTALEYTRQLEDELWDQYLTAGRPALSTSFWGASTAATASAVTSKVRNSAGMCI